jgi:AraC-like DNA-binding protein
MAVNTFRVLRVGASIKDDADTWWPLHTEEGIVTFEYGHRDGDRWPYNQRYFSQALATGKPVCAKLAGHSDLFVPIATRGSAKVVLITGPFARERPTSGSIAANWHWLTGHQPHLMDPQFGKYLQASLSTLVLEGKAFSTFERMVSAMAGLFAGEGQASRLVDEIVRCRSELEALRRIERAWEVVLSLLDDRMTGNWQSPGRVHDLMALGLSRVPDQVLVGLSAAASDTDALNEAVRRYELQRRVTELAYLAGDIIAGQVGDHGVVVLFAGGGRLGQRKQRILDFAQRVALLARREHGISLHFGVSLASGALGHRYQEALVSAEAALAQRAKLLLADPSSRPEPRPLRRLRRELGQVLDHAPDALPPKFERYLEAVAQHTVHRVELSRGHLEAGFERLAEPLVEHGALDEKGFDTLCEALDRRTRDARTLSDLFDAYRRAVADVVEALKRPGPARHDRGLRQALEYLHQHYTGNVSVEEVARRAGITPDYFSKLFKQRERTTFELYVRGLRLERAKQLLGDTGIAVGKVSEMSGFSSQQFFNRVFRQAVGTTPLAYRRRMYHLPAPRRH